MTEPCSSHHWHHSDWPRQCQRAQSGSHVSCTLTHTHRAVFYLSGCCLLSVWLGSLCLSACPPHKPNNATLLRLLQPWLAAQWKKRGRRTWRGGKGRGKWGKEKVTHGHGGWHDEIWAAGLGGSEGIALWGTQPKCTHNVGLSLSPHPQQPLKSISSWPKSPLSIYTLWVLNIIY